MAYSIFTARRLGVMIFLVVLILMPLVCCIDTIRGSTTWQYETTHISCDNLHLSINESVTRNTLTDFSGKPPYEDTIVLRYRRGDEWVEVDQSHKITPIYIKLYVSDAEYVGFESYQRQIDISPLYKVWYEKINADKFAWDVFVSPEQFSREEYREISRCLANNLDQINDALLTVPTIPWRWLFLRSACGVCELRPQIISAVYEHYDDHYGSSPAPVLGPAFQCPDEDMVLHLARPNWVQFRWQQEETLSPDSLVGKITEDQQKVFTTDPVFYKYASSSGPTIYMKPPNQKDESWFEYYQHCTNADGKNLFDYFEPTKMVFQCQDKDVTLHWRPYGRPPDLVYLDWQEEDSFNFVRVGKITKDHQYVPIVELRETLPGQIGQAGIEYYQHCTNADGKSLFDYFEPIGEEKLQPNIE